LVAEKLFAKNRMRS